MADGPKKGQDRLYGHFYGVESVPGNVVGRLAELGVGCLTLYAFQPRNWDRPQGSRSDGINDLLVETNPRNETLNKNNIRLHVIGDIDAARNRHSGIE